MVRARKEKVPKSEVRKKVHFFGYTMNAGIGGHKTEVDPVSVFDAVNKLPLQKDNGDNGRYLVDPSDQTRETLLLSSNVSEGKLYGQIAHVRRGARPSIEKKGTGKVRSIEELTADDGIVEVTHFVLYLEDKIIAVEYNHHGPRAKSIAYYLEAKARDLVDSVDLKYVTNRDFQTRLGQMDPNGIRMLQIKIPVNRLEQVQNIDEDIFSAMKTVEKIGQSEEIEIMLRPKKRSRATIDVIGRLRSIGEKLRGVDAADTPQDVFSGLRVNAVDLQSGRVKEFDLLEEHLVSVVHLVKENAARELDSGDMFNKMDFAYKQKRTEIIETFAK